VFERTAVKLEEARTNLDHLRRARTAQAFRSMFNATVNATRSAWDVLKSEGRHLSGFAAWRETKWKVIDQDDLLKRLSNARIGDFHQGVSPLAFGTYIDHISSSDLGPPPAPDATFVIGTEGPVWLLNPGKPTERRVPVTATARTRFSVSASLLDPPASHLGRPLERKDPITFCELAIAYFESLLYEARVEFRASGSAP
jgi:hypothetical protein